MALVLPKYVAFKGDNGMYLKRFYTGGVQYLQFSSNDISDSLATLELFPTSDGNVRIKNIDDGRFWRLGTNNWINPDSDGTSSNDPATLFRPQIIDDNSIALTSVGNSKICKRYTTGSITSFLNALADSVDRHSRLIVEEPVKARVIYDIKYDVANAKIYDEETIVLAQNSVSNYSDQPISMLLNMGYEDKWTGIWNDSFSLKSSVTVTTQAAIPLIVGGKVVVSDEIQEGIEWRKTETNKTTKNFEITVSVPPKSKGTVTLVAERGTCDVPFTYKQEDSLYTGSTVTYEYPGSFTGTNLSDFRFNVSGFEPL